jgi:hypothetical protein
MYGARLSPADPVNDPDGELPSSVRIAISDDKLTATIADHG